MVFITGDTHGDFRRFSTDCFPEQREMSREDYVLICGDFGGVWMDSPNERYWLDWLEDKPFTSSAQALYPSPCCKQQGSLTPLSLLSPRDPLRWVRVGTPSLWTATMRTSTDSTQCPSRNGTAAKSTPYGPTFCISREDRSLPSTVAPSSRWAVPGATISGTASWTPPRPTLRRPTGGCAAPAPCFGCRGFPGAELPGEEEYAEARRNLERAGWKVDYIITHCAPTSVQQKLDSSFQPDELTDFLQTVKRLCDFRHWVFGHYHRNEAVDKQFTLLWEQIVKAQA